jgi:1,2-diacylglycerol 3-beta-glucosyltransferase
VAALDSLIRATRRTVLLGQLGVAAATAYPFALTTVAWWRIAGGRHRTQLRAVPTTRFLVLIPAHDEELLIGDTLASLEQLDYPPRLFEVHVVADHCTDDTAKVVRRHAAQLHELDTADGGGKGPALRWLLEQLHERGTPHDAVLILDADTLVAGDFLRVMDARIADGERAIQSHYAVRDPEGSAYTGLRAVALAARHYLRPLARTAIGGSSGLYGNGMVFAGDLLRRRGFSDHLTEDIEFQVELLLAGTSVAFAADAEIRAEMPTTLAAARTQNERWERGRIDLARRHVPKLLAAARLARGRRRVAFADSACDLVSPPFSVLAAGALASGGVSVLVGRSTSVGKVSRLLAATTIIAQTAYVLSGLRMVHAPAGVYRSLVKAPVLVGWKLALWVRVLARPQSVSWIRTSRNEERQPA